VIRPYEKLSTRVAAPSQCDRAESLGAVPNADVLSFRSSLLGVLERNLIVSYNAVGCMLVALGTYFCRLSPTCLRTRTPILDFFILFFLPRPVKAPGGAGGCKPARKIRSGIRTPDHLLPRGKSQPLSLIFARIGGALEPNDSLKESRDALVTHSSTIPHATRIVFRAFDRSPSELGDSLVSTHRL
jgi:hypothetical protein